MAGRIKMAKKAIEKFKHELARDQRKAQAKNAATGAAAGAALVESNRQKKEAKKGY
jgi:hypothetical protein